MNLLDNVIGYFNPKAGVARVRARAAMESMQRGYEGGREGRRHSSWLERHNPSVNQRIEKDLAKLVARSRELTINDPYARKAPGTIANSVVGTGILPTPKFSDVVVGGKVVKVPNAAKKLEVVATAWKEWAEETTCDYNGDFNFYGLQHLVMRTVVVSGEALIIRKRVKGDVNKYGIQLMMLEGDYIDKMQDRENVEGGGYILHGIKYDANNKKLGYYIFDRHPSEGNPKSDFVSIENIVHVYEVERAGQNRGVPFAASTLLKQRDLADYEDAELLGKKGQACMPVFVTSGDPEAKDKEQIEYIEPGAVNYLNGGETVTFSSPPASNGFSEFIKTQQRAIANGYLMTYEMFTGDLSNVNFSSGRMGWIEFQRQVYNWQYLMLIPKMCDKVYQWFVEALQVTHGISKDLKIKAEWTAPRREMIDPGKELAAMRTGTRAGFTSWSEIVRQNGYDPAQVIEEIKKDQEAFKNAGLMPDWSPYFEQEAKMQQAQTTNANRPTNNNTGAKTQ